MKRSPVVLVFMFIPMIIAVIGSFFSGFSSIKIPKYIADITINDAGDMSVVEQWDMVYGEQLTVRFRDIKYNKYGTDYPLEISELNNAHFDETSVSVRVLKDDIDVTDQVFIDYSFTGGYDELGYPITCEPASYECESLFANVDNAGGLEGNVTFIYEYTILGAITQYSDISELNWRLFEYAEGKVEEADVSIHFPSNSNLIDSVYAWGHGLSEGTISITSNDQIDLAMTNIKTGEFIEFRILVENDLFPNIDSDNVFIHPNMNKAALVAYETALVDETNLRILIAQIVLGVSIAMAVLMVVLTYRVYIKYDKEYTPDFQGDYYRDLPGTESPAEMSYLYYLKKINDEDVTATLLDLIRRKYIVLDYSGTDLTSDDADFVLTLVKEADVSTLLPHEQHILTWFFERIGKGSTVSTKTIEKFGKGGVKQAEAFQNDARQFVRLAKKAGEKHNFFENGLASNRSLAMKYLAIPVISLFIALVTKSVYVIDTTIATIISIAVGLVFAIYVFTIQKRSKIGNELYVKWKAFRQFLVDFGNMADYPMPGVVVWEHFLVYATSLKVADKVMDQLKVKLPMDEVSASNSTFMGVGYRTRGFYYGHALGRVQHSISSAKTNSIQTIAAANAAKAGSGGGFSGGSSFGGGGGGGRSR